MRFGSVCSGIEAASVAWGPLDWKAAWFSEIEPFPSATLNHHYPDVPNYGDMTTLPERILSGEVEAPDVFCGGTPCQAFSVAGNRKSLDDARGNLSLTFCEIADAIDTIRQQRNQSPAIIFWENVPGVLNTKDNAFGCFLAEIAGETVPLQPSGGRWTDAGFVSGPKRTIAWRVLDAQYFGLAQRRRRVFVVASSRKGFNPPEVLFEFDSLRRDTAPSRQAGQGITADAESGIKWPADLASTLNAAFGSKQGLEDQHINGGAPLFVPHPVCTEISPTVLGFENSRRDGVRLYDGVTHTLQSFMGTGGGNTPCVTYGIPGNWIGRAPENGGNATTPMDNVAPCLTSADRHGVATAITTGHDQQVAVPLAFAQNQLGEVRASAEVFNTLNTNSNASGRNTAMVAQQVAVPVAYPINTLTLGGRPDPVNDARMTLGIGNDGDPQFTLQAAHCHAVATAVPANGSHWDSPMLPHPTLNQSHNTGGIGASNQEIFSQRGSGIVKTQYAVRRLTPVECERLQGFPDNYTNIPWRKKPESPDGPRYKALGNSWAVPVVRWIGERINNAVNRL